MVCRVFVLKSLFFPAFPQQETRYPKSRTRQGQHTLHEYRKTDNPYAETKVHGVPYFREYPACHDFPFTGQSTHRDVAQYEKQYASDKKQKSYAS
jgi:hypothetical protein